MKAKLNAAASLIALAGLLSGPAAQATNVASLPLKASVLAKPNVIFGLDDSSSMDSEVMLPTNDGAFWWDYNAKSGWDASGVLHYNAAGNSGSQWRKMVYLFPNGTGSGNRVLNDGANDHFAIPPTAAFAFLRSRAYNSIYYDTTVTYAPWAPGYVGSAVVSYANATATAAKSNPAYGSDTFDVKNTKALTTTDNHVFTAFPGMTLPAGAKKRECDGNNANCAASWSDVGTTDQTAANSKVTRLAMAYHPATFYMKETCTVDGSACVSAPDGATLKRYEIKDGNTFPSGRTYAAELQNFANWFQYYRKRKMMLNAAVGEVLEPLTGLRLGFMRFNSRPNSTTRVTMYDTDASSAAVNGRKVAGLFYETNGSGGTPTRETLDRIGEEYMNTSGPVQYACQRNAAFVMTDGFANVASVTIPAYDKATWGADAPFATTHANSLADIALSYFTTNIRSTLASGKVPPTDRDQNTNLHMNTYGLTMGARGVLYTSKDAVPPTDAAAWTDPTQNRHPSAVDDLWHATLNGRGQMYLADSPAETAQSIQSGLRDILSQTGAQGGVAVSTVNLSRGDNRAYFGTYNPAGWVGDISAHPIDAATGEVDPDTTLWSASAKLLARTWTDRVIATSSGAFSVANVAATVNPSAVYGADDDVINYLRGDRSKEGTSFRTRSSLIGAVINSEPAVQREQSVIYVQSGEGMLHAIDTTAGTDAGKELWAFVPRSVLASIGETTQRSYVFSTQLDGSPTLGTFSGGTLLVAGTGVAGRSFHALDVTSPRGLTEATLASKFKWEFPAAGDTSTAAKVGQALGRPRLVKAPDGTHVVLLTSGYNNDDGVGRMWMLDGASGTVLHEFDTGAGGSGVDAGLAQVTGYLEDDGTVRYVYGGDLLGNLWRFDLKDKGTPHLVATLKNASGVAQPVTAPPELSKIEGQRVVFVGTGRLLDISDFGSSGVQTMWAIADGASLTDPRGSLVAKSYDASADTISGDAVDWTSDRGWFLDLPSGQQINTTPTIAYGALAFVSNTAGGSDCSASSRLYVVDLLTGGAYGGTDFVSSVISEVANSSGVTALSTTDGKIVGSGQDADGNPWERNIVGTSPIAPAKNSWREIRRQ